MFGFSFLTGSSTDNELPNIFPMPILEKDFVAIDVKNIYNKILTDVMERTHGIPKEIQPLLWDNCLANEIKDGLVTMLAKAMANKQDLFIVYFASLKLIRLAKDTEIVEIKEGYKKNGEPVKVEDGGTGIFVSFRNYDRTDMVKFYSALEYCALTGLWKQSNASKSLQIKIDQLRASVSLADSSMAKAQAKKIADGMKNGNDVLTDAKDIIDTLKPDLTATDSTMKFIAQKRSFYLGMPASYWTGEQDAGVGDTGKGDTKLTERGLKNYYFSIAKPVLEALFSIAKLTFKSEDNEGLSTALETLKTMDITSDEYLSKDNKTLIVNKSFGLDENEEGDEPEEVEPPPVDPNAPPPNPAAPPPKE